MPKTGPTPGFLSKIFGKKRKKDIELPEESGRDPKLPRPWSFKDRLKANKEALNPYEKAGTMLKESLEKAQRQKRRSR